MYNVNRLKIGLFGANCSSGRVVTRARERWSGSWADNLRIARFADEAGIDFLLPLGRWKGYGGDTDYQGENLETLTWASGLLAATRRITVFGTVHSPMFNPVLAAKQMVTADQIGEGRFGLNIVVGWNEDEFEMFGAELRDHQSRYDYAQEWIDAIKLIWSDAVDIDFKGKYFDLRGLRLKPKPWGGQRPMIMNAGASVTGQAFAVRNCDAFFIHASRVSIGETAASVAKVGQYAASLDRNISFYTVGLVVCRPTMKEAQEYFQYAIVDNADWTAMDSMMARRNLDSRAVGIDDYDKKRLAAAVNMAGLPIVGDPDYVTARLADYATAGLSGVAISFVNFNDEVPYFCQQVLPRLERMGLRQRTA